MSQGKIFIVSACSGAGKTTLVTALLEKLKPHHDIDRVITYTTKSPRQGDVPGKDYHFVTAERFQELIAQGFFLEWSSFYDHYYGTPSTIITECVQGKSFILIIDRVGARQIKQIIQDVVMIWITVPTIEVLKDRLRARASENEAQIERRLTCAQVELQEESTLPLYSHHVVNDIFNDALMKLQDIFLKELRRNGQI